VGTVDVTAVDDSVLTVLGGIVDGKVHSTHKFICWLVAGLVLSNSSLIFKLPSLLRKHPGTRSISSMVLPTVVSGISNVLAALSHSLIVWIGQNDPASLQTPPRLDVYRVKAVDVSVGGASVDGNVHATHRAF
jgi:hypothetical protein